MRPIYIPGQPHTEFNKDGSVTVVYPLQILYTIDRPSQQVDVELKIDHGTCDCCGEKRDGDEPNETLCWSCYLDAISDYNDERD